MALLQKRYYRLGKPGRIFFAFTKEIWWNVIFGRYAGGEIWATLEVWTLKKQFGRKK
jgi:hypothetical protein